MIDVKAETERYYESAVELLKTLVSYESVLSEPQENMPYGKNCAQCLGAARAYLEKEGFLTAEFDNHAITAAFDEREPQLGILCHLDVVPAGDGWNSDPFTLVQKGNKLIGRGAIDDKGPAAAVITAMRIIKDSGIPIRKNVRLILGSNEENGSSDMEYYRSKEDFSPMLFTPDGSFPIITIEKGMIRCKITSKLPADSSKAIISLEGGTAVNAVPEKASVCLRGFSRGDINRAAEETHLDDITFEITENGDEILIKAKGKSAHASTPQQGRNAAAAIFTLLSRLDFGNETDKIIRGICTLFPFGETDGASAGVKCGDEKSGELTLVMGLVSVKDGFLRIDIDSRIPVSRNTEDISGTLELSAAKYGLDAQVYLRSEAHCVDENSDFIRTLLEVYERVSGMKGECLAIGGGTYVHDTENGVAFGAEWDGVDNHMHGADEFITTEELKKDIEMYTKTILRLCC